MDRQAARDAALLRQGEPPLIVANGLGSDGTRIIYKNGWQLLVCLTAAGTRC